MTKLNVRLLRKVRDAIARTRANTRRQFDMSWWGEQRNGDANLLHVVGQLRVSAAAANRGECKTACCIAGHAALEGIRRHKALSITADMPIRKAAERLLGISGYDAEYLFMGLWSTHNGPSSYITRAEALAYLDRCIEAGEIVR